MPPSKRAIRRLSLSTSAPRGGGGSGGSPIIVQFCGLTVLNMRTGGSKIMIILGTYLMEAPSREIMVSISFTLDECEKADNTIHMYLDKAHIFIFNGYTSR